MLNELPKFFEQILNIQEPWRIEKLEQEGTKMIEVPWSRLNS